MFLVGFLPEVRAADLPLQAIVFDVDVTGPLANVAIEQTFRNDQDVAIEATYVFPLNPDAAVDQLEIVVDDRVITGEIRERADAVRAYDAARAAGHVTALTTEERPNVFTQRVANLAPGATIRVRLSVVQPVPRRDGAYELVLPLVVAPRFVPVGTEPIGAPIVVPPGGGDGVPDAAIRYGGTGVDVDIDVRVHTGVAVTGIDSPSHPGVVTPTADGLAVAITDVPATRDFVLRWWTSTDQPAAAMLVAGDHAVLTLEPPRTSAYAQRVPREVVWVVDRSGSMSGAKIALAKRVMDEALDQMDPDDSFTVLSFSDGVEAWSPRPVPATDENVSAAHAFVGGLTTNGGTQMVPALLAALAVPRDPTRHRVIGFLGDGDVANDDQVLQQIAAHPEVTFTTIGIGAAPNRYVLSEMAALGGGVYATANLAEDPAKAATRILDALDRPVLTEIEVDWGDWTVDDVYPARIPDLRVGEPVLVAALAVGGSGPVTVTGRYGDGIFVQRVFPVWVDEDRPIVTTWARRRVAALHRDHLRGRLPDERAPILETGLTWGILTDYTAFLAVDRSRVVNPGGESVFVEQPLDLPDGAEWTRGVTMSAEFLGKIPTGRSYHDVGTQTAGIVVEAIGRAPEAVVWKLDGVQVIDPVTGTFSANFAYDAIGPSDGEAVAGPTGTNRLAATLSAAPWFATGARGLTLGADVGGPIRRDHAWAAATYRHTGGSTAGFAAGTDRAAARITAQPTADHRFSATIEADPGWATAAGATARYGGAAAGLSWQAFPGPNITLWTTASGQARAVAGDPRGRLDAAFGARIDRWDDHALTVEAGATRFAQKATGSTDLWVAAADRWTIGRWQLAPRVGVDAFVGDRAWLSPGLTLAWDATGDERTRVEAYLDRDVDVDRQIAGGAEPARATEVGVGVMREIGLVFSAFFRGGFVDERAPFAPLPDLTTAAAVAAAPMFERRLWRVEAGIVKPVSRRWAAEARYRWTPAASGGEPRLADPRSLWVPGFLEGFRAHRVSGAVTWRVPIDPWTLTLGATGAWASAVDGPGWWLRDTRQLGLRVVQRIPARKGGVEVEGSLTWAVRDIDASLWPIAALATLPGAPSLADQPPLRGAIGVSGGF